MHYFLAVIITFSFIFSIKGQNNLPDCMHPQEILLKVNEATKNIEENIYYQEDDSYTFWYKITVDAPTTIRYNLKSIHPDDQYEVVYYEYNGVNFCNDLVNKKIKSKVVNNDHELKAVVKNTYYFSILHIKGKGCGHNMEFSTSNQLNYSYTAIQNTCVEEIADEIVEKQLEPVVSKSPNLLSQPISKIAINTEKFIPITNQSIPKKQLVIVGNVVNANTNQPMDVMLKFSISDSAWEVLSTKKEGFSIETNREPQQIIFSIDKLGYKPIHQMIAITNDTTIQLKLQPIEVGEKIVMHKIYFHPNTPVLKENSKMELENLQQFLKENDNITIEIQGHTNGNRRIKKDKKFAHLNEEWNFSGTAKELSQLRAEKIKLYLQENGVDEANLIAKGYGGDKMIVENPINMQQAMKNIRVEIVVVEQIK